MKTVRFCTGIVVVAALIAGAAVVHADVKTEQRTQIRFEGMLGRMIGMFGGGAARDGIVSTVAVRGDRRMTVSDTTGQIIDLAEEKIYDLDMRRRTYRVTTFDELRRQLEEAERKAAAEAREERRDEPEPEAPDREVEIDFDVRETGERRTIAGHDTRQVIATIVVREKDRTLEEGGGLVLTADMWQAARLRELDQVAEFDRRYYQRLYGSEVGAGLSAEQMAAMLAMYPQVAQAMERFGTESATMDGTPLLTVLTMETVRGPEEETEAQPESGMGRGGLGGMLGGLGRRAAGRAAAGRQSERATIFTSTTETLSISTSVAAAEVAIPEGFEQR